MYAYVDPTFTAEIVFGADPAILILTRDTEVESDLSLQRGIYSVQLGNITPLGDLEISAICGCRTCYDLRVSKGWILR